MRLFAAIVTVLLLLAGAAEAKPTLVYVSAEDCSTCRAWERGHLEPFATSADRQAVDWREVKNKTLTRITEKAAWPAELEWLRAQVPSSGTPRFYLVEGERILARGDGISGWTGAVLPAIKALPR
jgi:hypothetical protein